MASLEDDDASRARREAMVLEQLARRGIHDERVLSAMSKVPRHLFVPSSLRDVAYDDRPLAIGHKQTISQPYMVALMAEAMELTGTERVLDVGTGSGYHAAVLGRLAKEVWSIEIISELAESARSRLAELGYEGVHVIAGDGSLGLPERAPFDAVVVAAGSPEVPEPLLAQLEPDGRLVLPVGKLGTQVLERIRRTPEGPEMDLLVPCAFVPLMGEAGWRASADVT